MNLNRKFDKLISYYKKNGFLGTLRKIVSYLKQRNYYKIENENYKIWIKNNEPTIEEIENQKKYKFDYNPKISVIVPMYNTKEKYLSELVDSLINQTYSNWELCLSDGSEEKKEYVNEIISRDERIKYTFLNGNMGISENSNKALELSTGEYVALLDHDDILPQFSLFEIVKVINTDKEAEFIYTDEDKIDEDNNNRIGPHFKQDFAPDTLTSYNYICHFSILKRTLLDRIGSFRKEFDGSQDYDLILRATEEAKKIIHIPKILYHWRMNVNSVALSSDAKPYAYEAAKKAILSHFDRTGVKAEIEDTSVPGIYKINYIMKEKPLVSIIILNKDHKKDLKRCIESIIKKTTYDNYEIIVVENNSKTKSIFKYYKDIEQNDKIRIVRYEEKEFNYSKINNVGVKNAKGEYIVLLNNDTKIITEKWIEAMLGFFQRKDVGVVGAKLLYKNSKVQHGGVVLKLGANGVAGHLNYGLNASDNGYMGRNVIIQNCSAVTGAMLMMSKKDYDLVGGLDESFPIAYNDVDLCLKIRNLNKVIVMNPFVQAYHFESNTRGYENNKEKQERLEKDAQRLKEKWRDVFQENDPYFNINFRLDSSIIKLRIDKTENN